MNKIKIISLILAVVMILPVLASCGGGAAPVENVTVIFRVPLTDGVDENGETIYQLDENGEIKYEEKFKYDIPTIEPKVEIEVDVTDENFMVVYDENGQAKRELVKAPTVLQAVQEAFTEFEIDYEVHEKGTHITSAFGYTEAERTDAEKGYFDYWECRIKGAGSEQAELSQDGRQSVTRIYTGDVIIFTWTSGYKNREDTTAAQTTSPDDTTGVIHSNDTTSAEDVEDEVA